MQCRGDHKTRIYCRFLNENFRETYHLENDAKLALIDGLTLLSGQNHPPSSLCVVIRDALLWWINGASTDSIISRFPSLRSSSSSTSTKLSMKHISVAPQNGIYFDFWQFHLRKWQSVYGFSRLKVLGSMQLGLIGSAGNFENYF